jgi:AcrR family transcriptional regulator
MSGPPLSDDTPASLQREREGGRPDPLTQSRVIDAAVAIVERVGFDRLTMRALADELGVTTMATYHYVSNKEQLLDLVADALLAIDPPAVGDVPWDVELRLRAFDTYDRLVRYQGLGSFLLDRPLSPDMRKAYARGAETFRRAGLDEREAHLAHHAYRTFMIGVVATHEHFVAPRARSDSASARSLRGSGRELLEYGIDLLVDGIRAQLRDHDTVQE